LDEPTSAVGYLPKEEREPEWLDIPSITRRRWEEQFGD
jgi:hypothetical protein